MQRAPCSVVVNKKFFRHRDHREPQGNLFLLLAQKPPSLRGCERMAITFACDSNHRMPPIDRAIF